ncbi:DUF6428 family protein [Paradesertivirga mongoliensis]|uniref:DUF6428 family protein n=1 Tax=Paradesertivirga mongoliensis TaxID=2100740 RepID=A0ABW4ZQV8_9SPHI|nr:DUF6428 family protein [Pedobacter mongoliensis]
METNTLMTWGSFKEYLLAHTDKHLDFRYAENSLVDTSYHITEIKLAPITSVDCGGKMNQWTEVIVQLWEPFDKSSERAMKVSKALSIISLVEKALPLDEKATVKIEFGNSEFDTRQMYPGQFIVSGDSLTVDLQPDFTQCKAIGRGGSCGTTDSGGECCTPSAEKTDLKLNNLAVSCCEPNSACC